MEMSRGLVEKTHCWKKVHIRDLSAMSPQTHLLSMGKEYPIKIYK